MEIKSVFHKLGSGKIIGMLRLTADDGKALTEDCNTLWNCIDVPNSSGWYEVDLPEIEEEHNETNE